MALIGLAISPGEGEAPWFRDTHDPTLFRPLERPDIADIGRPFWSNSLVRTWMRFRSAAERRDCFALSIPVFKPPLVLLTTAAD